MTNREFISTIKHDLKAQNIDQRVSGRYILNKAETLIEKFVEQMRMNKIMRQFDILSTINCFEMEKMDRYDCPILELRVCDKIMVSKEDLPDYFVTTSGYGFSSVVSIDGTTDYQPIRNLSDFRNQMKREFGKKFKYFYVSNKKLYIANSLTQAVTITGLFKNQKEVAELNGEAEICDSILDYTFVCPKSKEADVKTYLLQDIFTFRNQIIKDENPDLDENQRTKSEA